MSHGRAYRFGATLAVDGLGFAAQSRLALPKRHNRFQARPVDARDRPARSSPRSEGARVGWFPRAPGPVAVANARLVPRHERRHGDAVDDDRDADRGEGDRRERLCDLGWQPVRDGEREVVRRADPRIPNQDMSASWSREMRAPTRPITTAIGRMTRNNSGTNHTAASGKPRAPAPRRPARRRPPRRLARAAR